MDIFFSNSNDVPVPPDKMEIRELKASPHEDGRRVAIEFEITPFQRRPNIDIVVVNQEKQPVASFSIVEAIENKMTFTMHLREPEPHGDYQIKMELFYTELDTLEEKEDALIKDIILDNKEIIASSSTSFQIP
jgi:hypothetical protein